MKSEPKRKQRMEEKAEMKPEPKRKHKIEAEPEMKPEHKRKHKNQEDPEMPLDMNGGQGSVAVLDDEAPIESAPTKKFHSRKSAAAETKNSFMTADDTDTDK